MVRHNRALGRHFLAPRVLHVFGPVDLCTAHAICSASRIQRLCASLSRRASRPQVVVPRSVLGHGVCTTDLSRKPGNVETCLKALDSKRYHAGFRSLIRPARWPKRTSAATGEFITICASADPSRSATLRSGAPGVRLGSNGVRTRFDDDRVVSVAVSLGAFATPEGGNQAAYAAGPAGQHSLFRAGFHRENRRFGNARPVATRAGFVLHHGSRLQRLRAVAALDARRSVLCGTLPEQHYLCGGGASQPVDRHGGLRSDQRVRFRDRRTASTTRRRFAVSRSTTSNTGVASFC